MAPPTSILSRTLQSISVTKISEIEKQRARYEQSKSEVLAKADRYPDEPHKRIRQLSRGLKALDPEATGDPQVKNIKHWLQQARYDASVPAEMLRAWEELLRSKLEVQSRRLGLASLYSRLVTEWMNPTTPIGGAASATDTAEDDDENDGASSSSSSLSFEVVDRQRERLQELCDKFARVVFAPLETDDAEIDLLLGQLFEGEAEARLLQAMRRSMADRGAQLMRERNPFDMPTLRWCLAGLLAEDLLSDEKQAILREFRDNEVALREIGDVLNMRYADFDAWQWQAGDDGIPVLPRQQLNGKYRIWMSEDVLDAIFTEYVGVQCCILVKDTLKAFLEDADAHKVWKWSPGPNMSQGDELRQKFYMGTDTTKYSTVNQERKRRYLGSFFLSQLPGDVHSLGNTYDNDAGDVDQNSLRAEETSARNIKQEMLRTMATEVLIGRALQGEAAVVQSDMQWFATGLSHTTIFAVMRFFGLPDKLISFYKKVLEAPLNITSASGNGKGPRIRRRGMPMAHATEKFIGELVLFVMDLVVNREAGLLLYRLHDDLFLVGEPARCAKAWTALQSLARVMGLEFNKSKTGSVYLVNEGKARDPSVEATLPKGKVEVGHLILDAESGEWVIDQEQVQTHVTQLGKQLAACDSILSWVQTWNSCIGRFFSHTFGEPSFCLGIKHLDSVLEAYKQVQNTLFGNPDTPSSSTDSTDSDRGRAGNVATYLRQKLQERFGVSDISNGFIFLPEQLGGLGVRNPFIPMLVLRDGMSEFKDPNGVIKEWFQEEREEYTRMKEKFDKMGTAEERLRRMRDLDSDAVNYEGLKEAIRTTLSTEELDTFPTFDEYWRGREDTGYPMWRMYRRFVSVPESNQPQLDLDVKKALGTAGLARQSDTNASAGVQTEAWWVLQMFGDELRNQYGGLRLVDEKFLTLGVLTMMRSKAVRWNMVL